MAKQILEAGYVDDIMNPSMNQKRKYLMIHNEDGTVSFEDKTVYDQEGSDFGSRDVNAMVEAINQSADIGKILDTYAAIMATTENGYMAGALAVKNGFSSVLSRFNVDVGDFSVSPLKTALASALKTYFSSIIGNISFRIITSEGNFGIQAVNRGGLVSGIAHQMGVTNGYLFFYNLTTGGADAVLKKLGDHIKCKSITCKLSHSWGGNWETKDVIFNINYDDDGNVISVDGGFSGNLGNGNPCSISVSSFELE